MHQDCWFHYNLCFSASGKKNYLQLLKSGLHTQGWVSVLQPLLKEL